MDKRLQIFYESIYLGKGTQKYLIGWKGIWIKLWIKSRISSVWNEEGASKNQGGTQTTGGISIKRT